MTFQPGFSVVAALIADPAREAMLVALADGRALPAGELASAAGISAQSASRHLRKMVDGRVLSVWSQGRFRYYRITDAHVTSAIESLCLVAQRPYQTAKRCRKRKPPPELCFARRCYDHLAGELGVTLSELLQSRGYVKISLDQREVQLTDAGIEWLAANEILEGSRKASSPAVRLCMDWTERRPHLSGPVANAILRYLLENRFLKSLPASTGRTLLLTTEGRHWFTRMGGADAKEAGTRHRLPA
jgi:DNA-binding transcriptional ArsR family regulator